MKTTGVRNIPKFGLLVFLGHPILQAGLDFFLFEIMEAGFEILEAGLTSFFLFLKVLEAHLLLKVSRGVPLSARTLCVR